MRPCIHVGLAEKYRLYRFESFDHGRVIWRYIAVEHFGSTRGSDTRKEDIVFECPGDTGEEIDSLAARNPLVHGPCFFEGLLLSEGQKGQYLPLLFLNHGKILLDERDGGTFTGY
jgi:hypothetical protein